MVSVKVPLRTSIDPKGYYISLRDFELYRRSIFDKGFKEGSKDYQIAKKALVDKHNQRVIELLNTIEQLKCNQ